ncbi:MAG TPA: flagellar export chaperone FliS [Terracidiphilus sp.]|jgi:flagellar protein FliS|nr:flagellar export chaperone FliS [Terracidiphilus sp.]
MSSYREHALEGASAVDLVVALYDGIIRFLYAACAAIDRGDEEDRRAAVKRALDIIIHLQARLRMDVGGRPAKVLSEFYASIFAEILQGSQRASRTKLEHAIGCVRAVRDAWKEVARDPEMNPAPPQMGEARQARESEAFAMEAGRTMRWNA